MLMFCVVIGCFLCGGTGGCCVFCGLHMGGTVAYHCLWLLFVSSYRKRLSPVPTTHSVLGQFTSGSLSALRQWLAERASATDSRDQVKPQTSE